MYNPTIHRINQALRARAVDPDAPIGPPAEILLRYSSPAEKLLEQAKTQIEALIEAAEVKKGTFLFFCLLVYGSGPTNLIQSLPKPRAAVVRRKLSSRCQGWM